MRVDRTRNKSIVRSGAVLASLVSLVIGCGNKDASSGSQPSSTGSGSASRGGTGNSAPQATPQATDLELIHAIGAVVTVSSTVENTAHSPAHLVDRDPRTAWNARTGELTRAWINVEFPAVVSVTSIKLTAGFVATGSRGEDYFSMNHRVRRIRIIVDGQPSGEFDVDTERRDLQTFAVGKNAKSLRIEIAATRAGTKKQWSEVCISEFEVWGKASTPSAGPTTPVVQVDASHEQRCPSKPWLLSLIRASFPNAKRARTIVEGCYGGRFPDWRWYVTASVSIPAPTDPDRGLPIGPGDPAGEHYAFRAVFDYAGQPVALREEDEDPSHPRSWDSVTFKDLDGDHVEEIVEEVIGGGGITRRFRRTYKLVGSKIERVEEKVLGEYEYPSGKYTPY